MSKKQKQRTKGNVRPSRSGEAAELLEKEGGGHVGFVGFGALSGDLGYVPTSLGGFEDHDALLDADFRMVLRKLSKRDVVTKLKAIQEFQSLCAEKQEGEVVSMLPHWPRLYNRLSMDHDKRVREATQQMLVKVVGRVGRNLAPHLKALMGCWLMAQNDPYAPSASASRLAFTTAFPTPGKQANAVAFCKAEVIQLYKDNLFKETSQTLSDPNSFSKDEQEEKYLRVVTSSLLAIREFVGLLPEAQCKSCEEEVGTILTEDRLWKYAKHKDPMVRGAMYSLLGTLCRLLPEVLTPHLPKLCPALLGSLDETDPATVAPLWEAVLRLVASHQDCWKHVNVRKAFLPKLWAVLRQGGNGCASTIYPHLLPLLSHLPAQVKGQGSAFYQEFFNNFRVGISGKVASVSTSENAAILKSFIECLRYAMAQNLSETEDSREIQDHLVKQQLMPVLETSLQAAQSTKIWSVVTIYQQTAALLNYLHRQQRDDEKGSPARRVLESLWASMAALCTGHLTTEGAEQDATLTNVGVFLAVLKNPNSADTLKTAGGRTGKKKSARIRFAGEEEEKVESPEAARSTKPAEATSPSSEAKTIDATNDITHNHPQMIGLVSQLIQSSYPQARGAASLPHLKFLARLIGTFNEQAAITAVLESAGVNVPQAKDQEGTVSLSKVTERSLEADSTMTSTKDTETPSKMGEEDAETRTSNESDDTPQESVEDSEEKNMSHCDAESTKPNSATPNKSGPVNDDVRQGSDEGLNASNGSRLPLRCIYSVLLPWLLEVEGQEEELAHADRVVRLEAVWNMIVSILRTVSKETQVLVIDAVCLKVDTPELLHLLITKMRETPELKSTLDDWLRSDLFGEKLLSIQDRLCRMTLVGEEGRSSVGWKLIAVALSSGEKDEPVVGTSYAELLLIGFYRALTRPDVVTTAMQCIRFICDIASNFFTAVKGCVLLSSSMDLLLAIFQLECKQAHNLSISLREQVHQTWIQGAQCMVRQTGALLTERSMPLRAAQWVKQDLLAGDGNRCEQIGETAGKLLSAVVDAFPSNGESSHDAVRTLLESLVPTEEDLAKHRMDLPSQWISSVVIGQRMTCSKVGQLTRDEGTTRPRALNHGLFLSALIKELDDKLPASASTPPPEEAEEEEDDGEATIRWSPWECDVTHSAILEVLYVREWCDVMMCQGDNHSMKSPQYCDKSLPILSEALERVWKQLTPSLWQQLFEKLLQRSVQSGGLWSIVLDGFIQSNARYNDEAARTDVWGQSQGEQNSWFEVASLEALQTLERLVPHFSESERKELAEVHAAMLLSASEERITTVQGAVGSLTVLVRSIRLDGGSSGMVDLALGTVRQMQYWREKHNSAFLFSGDELEGASSDLLCLNTKMVQLCTCLVENIPECLESNDWDFVLCSLVSWVQACSEKVVLVHSSVLTATFWATTCDLLSAICKLFNGDKHSSTKLPSNLATEWEEFFSDGAYSVFLPAFLQFIEDEASWQPTPLDLSPLLLSLCEAASHTPREQLRGHHLPLRLLPGGSRHVPDPLHSLLNHLAPLLLSPQHPVQLAAFKMLERVMPEFAKCDEEYVQTKEKAAVDDEDEAPSISPPAGLEKPLDSCCSFMEALLHDIPAGACTLVEPGSQAYSHTRAYLLVWRLYLTMFRAASMEVRAQYSAYLKRTKGVHSLLSSLFCLMPENPTLGQERSTTPSKGSQVTMFTNQVQLSPKGTAGLVNEVQQLACSVYYRLLKDVPAIARLWWTLQDRRVAPYVDKFTTKYVSPLLCAEEIDSVQAGPSSSPSSSGALNDDNLTVRARPSTREVVATYLVQDLTIELTITLPANHPLGPVEVTNRKGVAVGTAQWRQWTLMLTTFLTHQNGSIMEGIHLWRSNADKRFEGIEDCMICFSVIHGANCSLPKITCKICKKRFHSACLYKWFSTSSQSSCPLCRSPF